MKRPDRRLLSRVAAIVLSYGMASSSVLVSVVAETYPSSSAQDDRQAIDLPAIEVEDEDALIVLDDTERVSVSVAVARMRADGIVETTLSAQKVTVNKGDDALTAVLRVLDAVKAQGGDYSYDPNGAQGHGCLTFITLPNGQREAATDGHQWELLVNGQQVPTPLAKQPTTEGDTYTLLYTRKIRSNDDAKNPSTDSSSAIEVNDSFADADGTTTATSGTTTAKTPADVRVEWRTLVGSEDAHISEPLWVEGDLFVAVGEFASKSGSPLVDAGRLVKVDATTGLAKATVPLAGSVAKSAPIAYGNGKLYVALQDGRVQALDAVTLQTRWVSPRPDVADTPTTSLRLMQSVAEDGRMSTSNEVLLLGVSDPEPSALASHVGSVLYVIDADTGRGVDRTALLVADDDGAMYRLDDSGELLRLVAQSESTVKTDVAPSSEVAAGTESLSSDDNASGLATQATDVAPEISLGNVGSKVMGRNSVATITLSQRVPSDLTSLEMWVDLPEVLEFYGTSGTVIVDGTEQSEVPYTGQHVAINPISGADAAALRSVSGDSGETNSTTNDGGLGKLVQLVFRVKAISDADLSAYAHDDLYLVPIHGESRINGSDSRLYRSEEKYLQITGEQGDVIAPPSTTESTIEGTESELTTGSTVDPGTNGMTGTSDDAGTSAAAAASGNSAVASSTGNSSSSSSSSSSSVSSTSASSSSHSSSSSSSVSSGTADTGDMTVAPSGVIAAGVAAAGIGSLLKLRKRTK